MSVGFDAVVLAGGEGSRLGGVDKALVDIGGTTMLDRVLAAVAEARTIVCVGPQRATVVPVGWTREDPPGGGPLAGLAAGLRSVDAGIVVVTAVDAPFLTDRVVGRLVASCREDGALLVDAGGRSQPLMAAYRSAFLRKRIASRGRVQDGAVGELLKGARLALLEEPSAARDVDTPRELEAARKELGYERGGP